jgi:TonB family protein
MRRWVCCFSLLLASLVFAVEEGPLLARVVDSSTERVPNHTVAPQYPRKARRDRIEGEVQVCFDVDRQGRTRRIAVRHSTHRAFESTSKSAVRESTFRPIGKFEEVPSIKSCRTFIFSLEPVDEESEVQ